LGLDLPTGTGSCWGWICQQVQAVVGAGSANRYRQLLGLDLRDDRWKRRFVDMVVVVVSWLLLVTDCRL